MAATKRARALSVLEQSARSIQDLDAPALAKIMPVLRAAHEEIAGNLLEWLARHDGAETFTAQRYRNALIQVRRAWVEVRQLAPVVNGALIEIAHAAGKLSTKNLVREWEQLSRIFSGSMQTLSLDTAAIIAKGDKLLIPRFASSARRYAGQVRENVIRELAISRVQSESIFETTNRLQVRLPQLFKSDRYAAERLARTEGTNAYATFHVEGLKQANADDEEIVSRWDASFDWRRCPMCGSLDGQVRNVAKGEKFDAHWFSRSKRRGLREHHAELSQPPGHPCCRCGLTPWHRDWDDLSRTRTPSAPKQLD